MRTTFYIELNIKTATGYECYGCFDLGFDRQFALNLFSKLEGRPPAEDTGVLQLDLVEKYRGLPLNMDVINCSVEELSRNVKTITKETFKRMNLSEMHAL